MEKSALTTEKINIKPNDARKESRKMFYESKFDSFKATAQYILDSHALLN